MPPGRGGGAAEREEEIDRGGQEKRRGVETGRGAGKLDGRDGVAEDGGCDVAEAVEEHDGGEGIGGEAQRAGIAEGKRCEQKQEEVYGNQAEEPNAEIEDGHGKPGKARANGEDGGVVDGQEAGERFVCDVDGEGKTESRPGITEGTNRRCELRHRAMIHPIPSSE